MALFSSNKRVAFQPTAYGNTRRKRGIPRWLMLILTGIVLGAGGVLFLQKSYGPTLLTAEESQRLQQDLNSANIDNKRLQSQLDRQARDLDETRTNLSGQTDQLEQLQARLGSVQEEIQMLVKDIPPTPGAPRPAFGPLSLQANRAH